TLAKRMVLDAAFLGRANAIVWDRRFVGDRTHLQTTRLNRPDCGFASGTGSLHKDIDFLHSMFLCNVGCGLGGNTRRVRRAFAAALEARRARTCPCHHISRLIAHGDDGVVEGRIDMRLTIGYILDDSFRGCATRTTLLRGTRHIFSPIPCRKMRPARGSQGAVPTMS